MVIFNERHLRRVLSLYVDQCGSSGEPFVAMMQSALRYGDDTSLLLPVYESDAGTPRKSPLLREILTKEGDAYVPLEKRLRTRGRQLVAQCVNFSESGAQ
jgi:hypothetical protein